MNRQPLGENLYIEVEDEDYSVILTTLNTDGFPVQTIVLSISQLKKMNEYLGRMSKLLRMDEKEKP